MPEYITDNIEISSDDSDKEILMKVIKCRKNYYRMSLIYIFDVSNDSAKESKKKLLSLK